MATDTLDSIAKKCGCSVSTVSRVLSGKAHSYRISEKTEKRVLEEAGRANYQPSQIAKSLRLGKTDTIGLLIPSIDDTFFSSITSVIIREARKHGYKVVSAETQEDERNELEGLSTLMASNVDGIIAIPSGEKSSVYEDVKRRGIPTVMLDRYYEDIHDIDVVSTDNYQAARMAVDHLVSMGHRRIGCVQGNSDTVTSKVRARGYRDAMKSHGLEASIMLKGSEFSIESSYDSTRDMLSDSCPPTAILALSNKILLGAIRSIQEKGLRVPEDISILSFDDNSLFNFLSPKITCIAQPVHEMGLKAVETLIAKIKGETETSRMFLSPSLVIRESVKRI